MRDSIKARWRAALRYLAAIFFIAAGVNHFRSREFYSRIVPPEFPRPGVLVAVSGVCEIAGGVALLSRRLRRPATWGLIALLIAVFPANIYMALEPGRFQDLKLPPWALWLRLPIQPILIAWVWFVRR